MVELIKARKKLAPIRLELSREMDGDVVETLCEYLEVDKNYVFREIYHWIFLLYSRSRMA